MAEIEDQSPLTAEELRKIDAYWRAANYLLVGQIYNRRYAMRRANAVIPALKCRAKFIPTLVRRRLFFD